MLRSPLARTALPQPHFFGQFLSSYLLMTPQPSLYFYFHLPLLLPPLSVNPEWSRASKGSQTCHFTAHFIFSPNVRSTPFSLSVWTARRNWAWRNWQGWGPLKEIPVVPAKQTKKKNKKVFPTSGTSWNLGWAFVRLAVCKWPFYDRTQRGSILTPSSPEWTVSNVPVHILKIVLGWHKGKWVEGLSLGELERVKYCTNKPHRLILQVFCVGQMVYLCNNNTN